MATTSKTQDAFKAKYGAAAESAAQQLGVPAEGILAQWALETGWGKSIIPGTNNLGNIKDFSGKGTGVTAKDNANGSVDKYRQYKDTDAFVADFVSLIQRKYPKAVGASTPEAFASALKANGYAEDPNYVSKISKIAATVGVKDTQMASADAAAKRGAVAVKPTGHGASPTMVAQADTRKGTPGLDALLRSVDAGTDPILAPANVPIPDFAAGTAQPWQDPTQVAAAAAAAAAAAPAPAAPAPTIQAMAPPQAGFDTSALQALASGADPLEALKQLQSTVSQEQTDLLARAFGDTVEPDVPGVNKVPSSIDRFIDKLLSA